MALEGIQQGEMGARSGKIQWIKHSLFRVVRKNGDSRGEKTMVK
jgi:hypothetical protein